MKSDTGSLEKEFHILQIEDSSSARMVCLNAAAYSIGRDSDSNAIVVTDPLVSRHHAILFRMPMPGKTYVYRLVDGDSEGNPSKNGISVNNEPCSERLLKTGDRIRMGEKTELTYLLAKMAQEDFESYFRTEELKFHSLKEQSLDPNSTIIMNTMPQTD